MGELHDSDETEISDAAISGYGRLLRAIGRRITTYATDDGGLICEDRATPARPTMWRISRDGAIAPDSPYSFSLATFVAASVPAGV
jgi:hypothetical protein